jgi:beta-galactosidase
VQEYGLRRVFKRIPDHPILAGLDTESLRDWRGEATILPPRVDSTPGTKGYPFTMWCGIEVSRAWRAGCYGNVASVLIEKPTTGDFLPIVDGGFNLQYSPLMQYSEGEGMVLFCQMDVTGRTEDDPAAMQLVANMLEYVDNYSPSRRRTALYAGDPSGKAYFQQTGISPGDYSGETLTSDQVLVVGPGGGTQLAPHKENITTWLEAGGNILAIGLDEQEARAFLPLNITMKEAEHISAYFEPAVTESPLAGISPAEVQIRDPRQLPLVTGGAAVIDNGVLAVVEDNNVVFCQLAPWQFNHEELYHVKMTFRRTSFLVTRLLANMGSSSATQLLSHFSTPVSGAVDVDDTSRCLAGLYLDKPVEMDDPYRFFRW